MVMYYTAPYIILPQLHLRYDGTGRGALTVIIILRIVLIMVIQLSAMYITVYHVSSCNIISSFEGTCS